MGYGFEFVVFLFPSFSGIQRIIDRLFSVFILCVLAITALIVFGAIKQRADVLSNAITGFETYRRGIAYRYALQGVWPETVTALPELGTTPWHVTDNRFTGTVGVENGAMHIHAKVASDEDIMSCRPAYLEANPTGPITWVCGSDVSMEPGWSIQGSNRTTISDHLIPRPLR